MPLFSQKYQNNDKTAKKCYGNFSADRGGFWTIQKIRITIYCTKLN